MNDKSYGIEVAIPDAFPAMVTGLATKEDAERWIERHKNEITKGVPQRLTIQRAPKSLGLLSIGGTNLGVGCFNAYASIVPQHAKKPCRCVGG